jgi:hypothetical protein
MLNFRAGYLLVATLRVNGANQYEYGKYYYFGGG